MVEGLASYRRCHERMTANWPRCWSRAARGDHWGVSSDEHEAVSRARVVGASRFEVTRRNTVRSVTKAGHSGLFMVEGEPRTLMWRHR
jgi:hypothetical protein